MLKYCDIFYHLLKFNLMHEMEYRKNFYVRLVTQVFFVVLQILIVDTFFRFTGSIGSWSKGEVFVLVGIFRLIEGAFHIFLQSNVLSLPETINYGEPDLVLTKPVNHLFLVSLKKYQLYETTTFLTGIVIIAFTGLISGFSWVYVFFLAFLGLVCLYSLMFFFSTLSFFVPRLSALSSIRDVVSKVSRFPLDIFSSSKGLLLLVAPLILVVTLPSQLVIGKVPPVFLLVQLFGTIILFITTVVFWRFALRHYSSASS